jgi:hypothetical protein
VTTLLEASRLAEAALFGPWDGCVNSIEGRAITALRQAIEQAEQDHTYGYAKGLAEAIFKKHFASDEHYASGPIVWGVNDTVIGILTQIDNMVSDMVRKPQQAEQAKPVAFRTESRITKAVGYWTDRVPDYIDADSWEITPLYTAPPRQPEQAERNPVDLIDACEYADQRWSGADVPIEWLRHFVDAFDLPQRKPLTDEQINEFFQGMEPNNGFWLSFARAIEAAHGIKGEA